MGPEIAIPLAIGGAAAGGGISAMGASSANAGIARTQRQARRAAIMQNQQVAAQAAQERQASIRQAAQLRARLSVSRGAAGIASGSQSDSFADATQQVQNDLVQNLMNIRRNTNAQMDRIRSGYEAQYTSLANQIQNPFLAAFTGGLQGLSSGLAIAQGVRQVSDLMAIQNAAPSDPTAMLNVAAITGVASGTPFPYGSIR